VLVESVKASGLEGLVVKRLDSRYEPGLRSGAWLKMRVNRGQEFVIGGYTIGATPFDPLIFGYDEDWKLIYAARTRNGLTPSTRVKLSKAFKKRLSVTPRSDLLGQRRGGGSCRFFRFRATYPSRAECRPRVQD
jgi:ATP-dependent DNA ligase